MNLRAWDQNYKAHAFYKKHGFEVDGDPIRYAPKGKATEYFEIKMACADIRPYLAQQPSQSQGVKVYG